MSIDEAIEKYKEIINTDAICPAHCNISCDKCVQESKQLAEWLEELKAYREIGTVEECRNNVLDIPKAYNKAIDDFVKSIRDIVFDYYTNEAYIKYNDFLMKAEQLKAGGESEQR